MRTSRICVTGLLLLLAAGCSRSPAPATSPSPKSSSNADSTVSARDIPVQIDNQNFSDMNVYLIARGGRWLVGTVPGMSKTTLTIPASLAPSDLRVVLRAEPIGGRGASTTPTLIVPVGQQIYWNIGSDPAMSTASVG